MKKIVDLICYIVLILIIAITGSYILSTLQAKHNPENIPSVLGFTPLTVVSGSMSPAIETGDIIFISKGSKNLKVGDIVTYKIGNAMATHRIMGIAVQNGAEVYMTKGDANAVQDNLLVKRDQIIGKYVLRIPYAGYVKANLRSWQGIVLALGFLLMLIMLKVLQHTNVQLRKERSLNQNDPI